MKQIVGLFSTRMSVMLKKYMLKINQLINLEDFLFAETSIRDYS